MPWSSLRLSFLQPIQRLQIWKKEEDPISLLPATKKAGHTVKKPPPGSIQKPEPLN
jgi:hypothetical protein